MAESNAVDAALLAKLVNDPTLASLMPGGVFFDSVPHGRTQFVIVSLPSHEDAYEFQNEAFETFTYIVKAVELSTAGSNIAAASARIHALLQDGTLSPTGYTLMKMQRTERIRYAEPDVNPDDKWSHRGGFYQVQVSPN